MLKTNQIVLWFDWMFCIINQRLRSRLIKGHLRIIQCVSPEHLMLLVVCFGSLSSDTGQNVSLQDALIVLSLHCALHRFKAPSVRHSKAKHDWAPSMFHSRYGVLSFKASFFHLWTWSEFAKNPQFCFSKTFSQNLLANSSLDFFHVFLLILGLLPRSPLLFKRWRMVRSRSDAPWPWN